MKRTLLAASCLLALALPASADIIFLGQEDLGGLRFGNVPRMLTLQTAPVESGSVTPGGLTGDAVPGADKSALVTLNALGWATGAEAQLAFNADTANTGISIQALIMTVYNGNSVVGTFSLPSMVTFDLDQVKNEQGNGNGVFVFGLNAAQQITMSDIINTSGSGMFTVGLNSTIGCGAMAPAGCIGTNDGPDTYIGIPGTHAVPGPIVGAGIPGLVMALGGMVGLNRFRRRKQAV